MTDRREFLAILASAVAALGTREAAAGSPHPHTHPDIRPVAHLGSLRKAYTFFNPAEVEFVEAAVARLIPNDELGPGALEADVSYFIDRLLTTEYGSGARFYNQGPFGPTTPYQGYQLPLTPPEVYRVGIAATNRYCEEKYGKPFAQLGPATQDEILKGLQSIGFEEVPGATFFGQLLSDTKDGFFSDPVYGGNQGMIGWKLVGFPGVAADYTTKIGKNEPYNVSPVDIHAVQQARIPLDEHGHPVHQRAADDEIRQVAAPPPRSDDDQAAGDPYTKTSFFV